MKDVVHHLKHVQKKVIQSARKDNLQEQIKNPQPTFSSIEEIDSRSIPTKKRRKYLNRMRYSAPRI